MKNILTVVIMLGYCLTALAQPKYGHSIYNGQSEISFTISNPILEIEAKYQSGQKEYLNYFVKLPFILSEEFI